METNWGEGYREMWGAPMKEVSANKGHVVGVVVSNGVLFYTWGTIGDHIRRTHLDEQAWEFYDVFVRVKS